MKKSNTLKNTALILLFSVIICFLCGCTQRIIVNEKDELLMYKWHYVAENGTQAELEFNDHKAFFSIYENDTLSARIEGYFAIDKNAFVITDMNLQQQISFNYKLKGNTVDIAYNDNTITMTKLYKDK